MDYHHDKLRQRYCLSAFGVSDNLPPNWTYVPGSALVTRPSRTTQIEPTTTGCSANNDICWAGLGSLAPGQLSTIVFKATPGPGVASDPPGRLDRRSRSSTSSYREERTGATANAGSGTYCAGLASA